MSEYKAMKFLIGEDPELSERVQNILFGLGYKWNSYGDSKICHTGYTELQAWRDGAITRSNDEFVSKNKGFIKGEYIDIDWLRTKKPETIELNGKKYIKSELEEAIKRIKPVEE
jgi:hypothetical protein